MTKKDQIWLEAGYAEFARSGPEAIKVDSLAASVGKSRSSFYHLFGDLDNFEDRLLMHHWEYSLKIVEELGRIDNFFPGFANLMNDHKDWSFTHINTFLHRHKSNKYQLIFDRVTGQIEPFINKLWAHTVDLENLPGEQTKHLFQVIREAIFPRLKYETFNPEILKLEIERLNESLQFILNQQEKK